MNPLAYILPTGKPSGQGAGSGIAEKARNAMTLPPLNLQASSSARSGDVYAGWGMDSSGFSVNYGSGVAQGSSGLLLIGAVVVLGVLLWKKST
jgi:hypothetical protein